MVIRWTREEDEELKRWVEQLGTDWNEVQRRFSTPRNKNALIRRWHGRIREDWADNVPVGMEAIETPSRKTRQLTFQQPYFGGQHTGNPFPDTINMQQRRFQKQWTEAQDDLLRYQILQKAVFDWNLLASTLNTSKDQVVNRWQHKIYPTIQFTQRVAGALKWSKEQDNLLLNCQRVYPQSWQDILQFLSVRSIRSIEARWKKLTQHMTTDNHSTVDREKYEDNVPAVMNKYEFRKMVIRKIAEERSRQAKQPETNI